MSEPVESIINAALPGKNGRYTITLSGPTVESVEPQPAQPGQPARPAPPNTTAPGRVLDADSGLVTPALVDPHVHLDLAYSLDIVPPNRSGTLLEAIALWSEAKKSLTPDNVQRRAVRAIHAEVEHGTGLIRSHVDVGSTAGMRLVEGVLAARDASRDLCDIQLVAFPQDGLVRDPEAVKLVRDACRSGVDLVGGIPHIERTPRESIRHLEILFDLAAEFDADIDVHIDESDDEKSVWVEHLASLTIERSWQGRVTASHVCALSSYAEVHAARVMDLIAEAQINVVTNPAVNLHLQGRFDRYPKRRGLTRVGDLLARGVACAAGQDCIKDPFYPLGNGRLLDQAFLLVHAEHMSTQAGIESAFDMVCSMAGAVVGRPDHRVEKGARADLALFPAESVTDLVRQRPNPTSVIHAGRLIRTHTSSRDATTATQ